MLADFCSRFLEHGPHSGQRQLLEDVLHLLWWIGHISSDPPFEQGEKGPGQILRDHRHRHRRRTPFSTKGGQGWSNLSAGSPLQGLPQKPPHSASHPTPYLRI